MKKNTIFLTIIISVFVSLVVTTWALPVFAQNSLKGGIDQVGSDIAGSGSGLATGNVTSILTRAINWLLALAAILALAALIYGGIRYIISFGDEKRAEGGKKTIYFAIVGLIIVGLSFAIIKTIQNFLTGP